MDEFQLSQRVEALQTIAAHYDQQLRDINAKVWTPIIECVALLIIDVDLLESRNCI
jgi:hypothetical protein